MRGLIERYLIEGVEVPAAPAPAVLSKQQIARVLGRYQAVTTRFRRSGRDSLRITENAGKLFSQHKQNDKVQLLPVNAMHYRRKNETTATIAIVIDEDGNTYYQGDAGNFVKIPATGTKD